MTILYDCQISATNNAFVLTWLGAKVLEINGQTVGGSEKWQKELASLEAMFQYAPFLISKSGEFVEALNVEESIKRLNELLDKADPDRPQEMRDYYTKLATSESGKLMTDRVLGQIWETWVEAWIAMNVVSGEQVSREAVVSFNNRVFPATEIISCLGVINADKGLLSLKYEQKIASTNLSEVLEGTLGKLANETELQQADPLPKDIQWERTAILEVHTERKSLKPHWAKRTVAMTTSGSGESKERSVEVHEYRFFWDGRSASGSLQ